jgi:hypothetical protein
LAHSKLPSPERHTTAENSGKVRKPIKIVNSIRTKDVSAPKSAKALTSPRFQSNIEPIDIVLTGGLQPEPSETTVGEGGNTHIIHRDDELPTPRNRKDAAELVELVHKEVGRLEAKANSDDPLTPAEKRFLLVYSETYGIPKEPLSNASPLTREQYIQMFIETHQTTASEDVGDGPRRSIARTRSRVSSRSKPN